MILYGVSKEDEVAKDAVVIAHVIAQESLGLEAERSEHCDGAVLVSDNLDGQLGEAMAQCLQQSPA